MKNRPRQSSLRAETCVGTDSVDMFGESNIRRELSPRDAEAFARIFGDIDAAKKANVERFD